MTRKIFLIVLSSFVVLTLFGQTQEQVIEAAQQINYDDFFKHVEYLASDELEGRDVGSKGYDLAAKYVASEFQKYGLLPFGDNQTYFQKVPFNKGSIKSNTVNIEIENPGARLRGEYNKNVALVANLKGPTFYQEQELVFVGYGIVSDEDGIDDYKGLDVEGKTIIMALGAPKGVKVGKSPMAKVKTAIDKGVGGIIVYTPRGFGENLIFNQLKKFANRPIMEIDDPELGGSFVDADLLALSKKKFIAGIVNLEDGVKLRKELRSMKKGTFTSRELSSKFKCSYELNLEDIDCKNVVALLPGTDPLLKDEYVVVSAHLDHLGVGKPVKKDSIYNGMWDNATGVAATISIAKAFKDAGIEPKRSVIFTSFTGEEKGLYGSAYFAGKIPLDSGQIVANINIDMLGNIVDTKDITPLGYNHSNLAEAIDFAAKEMAMDLNDAEEYEHDYLERSDQISLIKKGTPALYINGGENALDPKQDGRKAMMKWMRTTYHKPSDDLNQEYSPEAFHKALKINFLATYYTVNELEKIEWYPESWIYKKHVLKEK